MSRNEFEGYYLESPDVELPEPEVFEVDVEKAKLVKAEEIPFKLALVDSFAAFMAAGL